MITGFRYEEIIGGKLRKMWQQCDEKLTYSPLTRCEYASHQKGFLKISPIVHNKNILEFILLDIRKIMQLSNGGV